MRAITVEPGKPSSGRLEDIPEPPIAHGPVLVKTLAVGVCGTDIEIVGGGYGWAPPGKARLVIGHESLGEVLEAPPGSGLDQGDRVVGIVRRPDPVPCASCAAGEWDMCRNGPPRRSPGRIEAGSTASSPAASRSTAGPRRSCESRTT
ncbi:hypothetical protein BE21_40545 [Sorangium cellulosum]|uniref:Alcohol dehydrogenase-like N-terminal domain-containing protein n=1 Tax=Sorangium cellulosum TaxID=56 RepID=A0A150TLA7_SORCE|nr:hypothetical protein BE21_40545 [Sorangium cellulosum]